MRRATKDALRFALVALICLGLNPAAVHAAGTFKVGILKFGTVNWFLDVIKHHGLDEKAGFELELRPLASKNATSVALLSGAVDSIVTDWFWALRERALGEDFVLIPYSAALGAVVVPKDSAIRSIADLKGRKIGVAGGPLDKSWLLLRARSEALGAGDLAKTAEPVYGAPPLLNQQVIQGNVDAVLNFWHFAARLEGAGYRRIAGVSELAEALGVSPAPPMIGFVFRQKLADDNPDLIDGFAAATRQASEILQNSDAEWLRLRPMMGAGSDAEFIALRDRFRAGALRSWGDRERAAAGKLFDILRDLGGDKLTGKDVAFDANVFWPGLVY